MQELENKKAALELLQNETNEKLNDYKQQISILQKQIDDYNKPALTPAQIDAVYKAIEDAVEGFNFDDTENYEVEFGMEYDGKVHLETIGLQCAYELTDQIVNSVMKLFKEADCPEELDTTEPDHHKPQ
tara:strand:+ start:60 stop:446 length:387 start_codon:yes stop_codon:yes gene_type:complete